MKKKVLLIITLVLLFVILTIWLFKPMVLSYDEIKKDMNIISDDYITIYCNYELSKINFLAHYDGTVYLYDSIDGGRCYKQSIQIATCNLNKIFRKNKTIIYKHKLTNCGAINGKSIIISDDETTTAVIRYDVEILYRDINGIETTIWAKG